jgi:hypothetical protein
VLNQPDLMITEVADPQDYGAAGRYVEIYNPGTQNVDLSNYALRHET